MDEKTFQVGRFKVPIRFKPLYDRVQTGKSLRSAAKARCLDCCVWQPNEVKLCPAKDCPLWLYRPYGVPKATTAKRTGNPASLANYRLARAKNQGINKEPIENTPGQVNGQPEQRPCKTLDRCLGSGARNDSGTEGYDGSPEIVP